MSYLVVSIEINTNFEILSGSPSIATKLLNYKIIDSDLLDGCQPKQYHSAIQLDIETNNELIEENVTSENHYTFTKANWALLNENLINFEILSTQTMSIDNLSNILLNKISEETENYVPKITINSLPKMKIQLPKKVLQMITH